MDLRGGTRLARESLRHHRIGGDLMRRHLDRDDAVEPELAAAIDRTERTAAELGLDHELVIDRVADEVRRRRGDLDARWHDGLAIADLARRRHAAGRCG